MFFGNSGGYRLLRLGIGGERINLIDQIIPRTRGLMIANLFEHGHQTVMGELEQVHHSRALLQQAVDHRIDGSFQAVTEITDGADPRHTGTALEGVQLALQGLNQ